MFMGDLPAILKLLAAPLFLTLVPFAYQRIQKFSLGKSLKYLLLNKEDFRGLARFSRTFGNAILLLAVMLAVAFLETSILALLGMLDIGKVQNIILRQPPAVIAIAIFISPISEEIFFRGFLQRKLGVLVSAIAFGLSHAGYGSIAELTGALILGFVLGLYAWKNKSIAAPIFAHMMFNAISIIAMAS